MNRSIEALKPAERRYWQRFVDSLPCGDRPGEVSVTAEYAGSSEITDDLLALYLEGKKIAGSSLMEDFLACRDPLPQVGNYWILLNSKGQPRCILRTEKIVMNKFKDVPVEIAQAEGEGDSSLEYWRQVHSEIYSPSLGKWGISDLEEATVITEFFSIVYR